MDPSPAERFKTAGGMFVERFPVGKHQANAWLAYAGADRAGVVVDPGAEGRVILSRVSELDLDIRGILLTHAHWDHVGAADEVASGTGAPVYLNQRDEKLLKAAPIYGFRMDGIRIPIPSNVVYFSEDLPAIPDAEFDIEVSHTPGHTEGGTMIRVRDVVFTGDTLLPGDVGRTDLPGGDRADLRRSLLIIKGALRDDDLVCPGHGATSSGRDALAWIADSDAHPSSGVDS